jgi:ATP phosphoribosyltransferase regulatory subunit
MHQHVSPLPTVLPAGLRDVLHPDAARERFVIGVLLDRFVLFGYQQVSPPLMEYESSLFAGKGQVYQAQSFRVMDAESQTMMALRADITTQIERIAARMLKQQDAVRLSYVGNILRTTAPHGAFSGRQLRQAGIEMIGARVDALETITAGLEALELLGIKEVVVTLCVAGLIQELCPDYSEATLKAIYNKDSDSLDVNSKGYAEIVALLHADTAHYSAFTQARIALLHHLSTELTARFDKAAIVIDPLDTEDFPYHHGVCFTILDKHSRQDIGRGGMYDYDDNRQGCGMTLYLEKLAQSDIAYPLPLVEQIISDALPYAQARALRDASIITIKENKL